MSGKESGFIAGADIREFEGFDNAAEVTELVKQGHAVFAKLENLKCPTVAAVSGFCVGGGYELALCCDYIMVLDVPDTRVGLPEIQLGIVPGLGGTVRLNERVGGMKGMTAMLTGSCTVPGRPEHLVWSTKSSVSTVICAGQHAGLFYRNESSKACQWPRKR